MAHVKKNPTLAILKHHCKFVCLGQGWYLAGHENSECEYLPDKGFRDTK